MKILHTADIHLKDYQDNRWETLRKLVEVGKKEEIEVLAISGDLFDKGIDAEALRPRIRELFSKTGFKVVLIPGNHDIESYKSGVYFGEDVEIISDLSKPYEANDLRIWGFPFEDIEGEEILRKLGSLRNILKTDKTNILLYHGELLDAFFSRKDFGKEGAGRYMPVKLSYFKDLNIDYVLAGHFHSKFEVWELEDGGYFVYPGSPVSITRRETGRRKVNIFEIGKPPEEYPLDTPHFEEVDIELDPFKDEDPVKKIREELEAIHPDANILLRVTGYIESSRINMSESELVSEISKITENKPLEIDFGFRDIHTIFEDDLFKDFRNKLEEKGFDDRKKKRLLDLTVKAMLGVKL